VRDEIARRHRSGGAGGAVFPANGALAALARRLLLTPPYLCPDTPIRREDDMNSLVNFGRLDAVERALSAGDSRHPHGTDRDALPPPTIAISRQAGSNASAIARAVGERLGWPVYDRELIDKIAEEMKTHSRHVEAVDEHPSGWLAEFLESFSTRPGVSEMAYLRRLRPAMQALAQRGECVIVGRGAAQVLPAATTLRVRLVGPLEGRIAAVQKRFGATAEEARRRVMATDALRNRFVRDNFLEDPDDPGLYDLALNVCRLSVEDCARVIVAALEVLRSGGMLGAEGKRPVAAAGA
jgi:cytidylate kinase